MDGLVSERTNHIAEGKAALTDTELQETNSMMTCLSTSFADSQTMKQAGVEDAGKQFDMYEAHNSSYESIHSGLSPPTPEQDGVADILVLDDEPTTSIIDSYENYNSLDTGNCIKGLHSHNSGEKTSSSGSSPKLDISNRRTRLCNNFYSQQTTNKSIGQTANHSIRTMRRACHAHSGWMANNFVRARSECDELLVSEDDLEESKYYPSQHFQAPNTLTVSNTHSPAPEQKQTEDIRNLPRNPLESQILLNHNQKHISYDPLECDREYYTVAVQNGLAYDHAGDLPVECASSQSLAEELPSKRAALSSNGIQSRSSFANQSLIGRLLLVDCHDTDTVLRAIVKQHGPPKNHFTVTYEDGEDETMSTPEILSYLDQRNTKRYPDILSWVKEAKREYQLKRRHEEQARQAVDARNILHSKRQRQQVFSDAGVQFEDCQSDSESWEQENVIARRKRQPRRMYVFTLCTFVLFISFLPAFFFQFRSAIRSYCFYYVSCLSVW